LGNPRPTKTIFGRAAASASRSPVMSAVAASNLAGGEYAPATWMSR